MYTMRTLSSGEQCIKYILFIFNFIIWLAGSGVLAIALWLRFDDKTKGLFSDTGSPSAFFIGVYVLIAAGAIMMVVGFLGCCGAIKESSCMLGLFFLFLLVIFAGEVAAGIWGFSNKDQVVSDIQAFYNQTYNQCQQSSNTNTGQNPLRDTLTAIQLGLNCCGPTGTVSGGASGTCPTPPGQSAPVTTSCTSTIESMFTSKLHIVGGVGIGIGVIMIFGMIFSMVLCCAIRRSRDTL